MFKTSPFTQMPLPKRPSIQPIDKPRVEPRVDKSPVVIQPSLLVASSPTPIIQEAPAPQRPTIQVADKPRVDPVIQDKTTPVDDVPVKKPFNYKPVMIGGGILLVFLLMR